MGKIIAILGPTGVGKTDLSIKLAKELDAEIINCDSMQIYKEFSIGVAKITENQMQGVPHHLLDIRSVTDHYNAYDYQSDGRKIIEELQNKNKNIIIVGGTGLYLKALLYNYSFNEEKDESKRIYDFTLVALSRDREELYSLINNRVDQMMDAGLLNEVKALHEKKLFTRAIRTAIGYKELYDYLNGIVTLEEAIENIKLNSRHYAKRQYTFFNHQFDDITWYDVTKNNTEEIINQILDKE